MYNQHSSAKGFVYLRCEALQLYQSFNLLYNSFSDSCHSCLACLFMLNKIKYKISLTNLLSWRWFVAKGLKLGCGSKWGWIKMHRMLFWYLRNIFLQGYLCLSLWLVLCPPFWVQMQRSLLLGTNFSLNKSMWALEHAHASHLAADGRETMDGKWPEWCRWGKREYVGHSVWIK